MPEDVGDKVLEEMNVPEIVLDKEGTEMLELLSVEVDTIKIVPDADELLELLSVEVDTIKIVPDADELLELVLVEIDFRELVLEVDMDGDVLKLVLDVALELGLELVLGDDELVDWLEDGFCDEDDDEVELGLLRVEEEEPWVTLEEEENVNLLLVEKVEEDLFTIELEVALLSVEEDTDRRVKLEVNIDDVGLPDVETVVEEPRTAELKDDDDVGLLLVERVEDKAELEEGLV